MPVCGRPRVACRLGLAAAVLVALPPGLAAPPAPPPPDLKFAADRPLDVQHIKLELAVDLEKKRVDGTATITMTALRTVESVTFDAVDFVTQTVAGSVGGGGPRELAYANDGRQIEVFFGQPVAAGTPVEARITYSVEDPKDGLHFFSPKEDGPEAPYQVWSQGESIENRYWFPCFDHPNEMQTTELIATVDEKYKVLSNGKLVGQKAAGPGKVSYHWRQDQPHVAYLVTLVVGDFAIVEENWRGKPVQYWVPPDRVDEVQTTFGNTTRMLDFFSDHIGVEYAWDKYAQVCCYQYGGGMENTSATTLGERALHDARSKLDATADDLLAHEMAHQWFGDLLTCRDWAHIWLNEGFASYFEALWGEFDLGPDEFAYDLWQKASGAINGGKQFPIVHRAYTSPDQQFDSRAYPKGAWVLHMLRRRLGDETFWKVINRYVSTHRHQTVETADLRKTVEELTGGSWERFFYDWTERPGHPVVKVRLDWREDEKAAEVTVEQTQEVEAFHFPLTVELRTADGKATVVRRDVTDKKQTLLVPLSGRPTLLRVDPEQSVLMELEESKGQDLWLAQLKDDPSPVGRIRAAQQVAKNPNDANRRALAEALAADKFWAVQNEIAEALGKLGGDIAREALLAGLKHEHPKVRRACLGALKNFPKDEAVCAAVAAVLEKGDASLRVESAAAQTYAALEVDDVVVRVTPLLERESRRDELRSAALSALAQVDDAAVLELILPRTGREHSLDVRQAAVGALRKYAVRRQLVLDGPTQQRVLDALAACLEPRMRRLRMTAVEGLGELGRLAAPKLEELRRVAAADPDGRVREAAKRAAERIEQDRPSQEQISDLRKQLDEMKSKNEELLRRLEKLEARAGAGPAPVSASQPAGAVHSP